MKRFALLGCGACMLLLATLVTAATPQEELRAFRQYFQERHPEVAFDDFQNGIYSLDADRRAEWEAICGVMITFSIFQRG